MSERYSLEVYRKLDVVLLEIRLKDTFDLLKSWTEGVNWRKRYLNDAEFREKYEATITESIEIATDNYVNIKVAIQEKRQSDD